MPHTSDIAPVLSLDERIRQAEQAVIDRDLRLYRLAHDLTDRWHDRRMPSVAQGAGAGLLAGLGSWFVRRAFAARPAARHAGRGGRVDLLLQFLPLLLPVLPARLQRWVRPSRLMLGLALAAPLWSAWQARRERAREAAQDRALIDQVLAEQRRQYEALRAQWPEAPAEAEDDALHDMALHQAVVHTAQPERPSA